MADEMLIVYVVHCLRNKLKPTSDNFLLWYGEVGIENRNFKLAFDFVFGVLHPLFLFRAAVRQCNDKVIISYLLIYTQNICYLSTYTCSRLL
jgi:hypothetical protein